VSARQRHAIVLTVGLLAAGSAHAQWTWTGGGANDNWTNTANWNPASVPASGANVSFPGGSTPIVNTAVTVGTITKTGGGAATISASGGNSLTINGGITRNGGTLNISAPIVIGTANEPWSFGAGTHTFSGAISGASFNRTGGGGILVLSGANTFTGATVTSGNLRTTTATGFGSGTITLAGGTLSIVGAAPLTLPVSLVTAGNATLNIQNATHTVANITVNAGNTLTLTNGGGADLTVSGTLAVAGTVSGGGGGLVLTAAGMLTGTGTVRSVTVPGGANLTPGTGGAGNLTIAGSGGNLTLAATTNLNFTVGTTATQVTVNGNLVSDGVLNVTTGPGFAAGTFALMTAGGTLTNNHIAIPAANFPAGFAIGTNVTGGTVNLVVAVRALALDVTRLESTYDSRHTQVAWTLRQEQSVLGYRLWKEDGSARIRVGPDLVPGGAVRLGVDLKYGPSYVADDWTTTPGGRYWVESIGMDGLSSWIGPVVAQPGQMLQSSTPRFDPARVSLVLRDGPPMARVWVRGDEPSGPASDPAQWKVASAAAAKIDIREPGVYRVPAETLFSAGIPVGARLDAIKLSSLGFPVSFRAVSADGVSLNTGDAIEFYGHGVDRRYTDVRTYWVTATLGAGPRIVDASDASGAAAGSSFPETLQFRDHMNYFGSLKNGGQQKFFGPWVYDSPALRTYSTPAYDLGSSAGATLEVALQGVTLGQHAVLVSLNGMTIGALSGNGQQLMTRTIQIPAGLLRAGDNVVQLVAPTPGDASFEVYQRLNYPRLYEMTGGPLNFTAAGGSSVRLAGAAAATLRVLDITSSTGMLALKTVADPNDPSASLVSVPTGGERRLYAYTDADVKTPLAVRANKPSSIHSGEADLVVIGYSSLLPALEPLAAQRRADGLQVALVDIEDVYDEFSNGEKDADAIRSYLTYAWENWSRPPQYLLLVGSASYDPRNFTGGNGVDLVPTALLETQSMEASSDDALADLYRRGVPEMAVGRLPLSDSNAVGRAVTKILGRELATSSSRLLFVHDEDDLVSKFSTQTTTLRDVLSAWPSTAIGREAPSLAGTPDEVAAAQAANDVLLHAGVLEALVAGPAAVNYFGHGAKDHWGGDLLSGADAAALSTSARASVFFAGTCLNGDFGDFAVDPMHETLAASLLAADTGGAWAIWASTATTMPGEQSSLATRLWQAALVDGLTLGDATLQAKSGIRDADTRTTFQLFGDPSARMAPAKGSTALSAGGHLAAPGIQSHAAMGCSTSGETAFSAFGVVVIALAVLGARRKLVLVAKR